MAECNQRAKWQGQINYRRVDGVLKAASAASVKVVQVGTNNAINLYSDHTGTPKANPFILDGSGNGDFYVDEADCIFDMIVEAAAGEFATFRRRSQTAAWADLSPWPYDMDANEFNLERVGAIFNDALVVCSDNDLPGAIARLAAAGHTSGGILVEPGIYDLTAEFDPTNGGTISSLAVLGYGPDCHIRPANAGFPVDEALIDFPSGPGGRVARFWFQGLRFDGRNLGVVRLNGINLKRCDNVWIRQCWFHDFSDGNSDGIRVGNHTNADEDVSNVHIDHCDFRDIHRNGISVIAGQEIHIEDSEFEDCHVFAVDIEPNAGGAETHVSDVHHVNLEAKGGDQGASPITQAHFACVISNTLRAITRTNFTYTDCTSKDSINSGFLFINGYKTKMVNCQARGAGSHGMEILGVNGLSCSSSEFSENVSDGVSFGVNRLGFYRGAQNVKFDGCEFATNGSDGVQFQEGPGPAVQDFLYTVQFSNCAWADNTGGAAANILISTNVQASTFRLIITNGYFTGSRRPIEGPAATPAIQMRALILNAAYTTGHTVDNRHLLSNIVFADAGMPLVGGESYAQGFGAGALSHN